MGMRWGPRGWEAPVEFLSVELRVEVLVWATAVVGWIAGLLVLDKEMGAHRNGRALESGFDCSVFGCCLYTAFN